MKNSTVLDLVLKPGGAELCQSDVEGGEMNFEMSGTYQSWWWSAGRDAAVAAGKEREGEKKK